MSFISQDDQTDKKPVIPQTKANPPANQSKASKKLKKTRKKEVIRFNEVYKKSEKVALPQPELMPIRLQKAKKKWRDGQGSKNNVLEITCYSCNKKGHYSRDCTKPKT